MGVLKRKQTLLGKEGIGPAFARGQRVRDRWESFLEVTLVSRIELHSVRAIGLGGRPEAVPLQLEEPSRSKGSRTRRATIGVIIFGCLGV